MEWFLYDRDFRHERVNISDDKKRNIQIVISNDKKRNIQIDIQSFFKV